MDAVCAAELKIYITKTNQTVPEGFLLALGSFGETVFIKMNNSEKPYMFSANDARPKTVYREKPYILGISAYKKIAKELPKRKKKFSEADIPYRANYAATAFGLIQNTR